MRWQAAVGLLGVCAGLLGPGAAPTRAQDVPEGETYETTRGLAQGTGNRASARSTSALAYNPAAMALAPLYHISSYAGYRPDGGGWTVGGAAVDSVTNKVAAGLSVRGAYDLGPLDYKGYDGELALAVPLAKSIAVGVTGRFLKLRPQKQADSGTPGGNGVKGFTMDASVAVHPVDQLDLAAFGYNLIDRGSPLTPRQVGGSAAINIGNVFTIGGEGIVDLSTFEDPSVLAGGGAEFLAGGTVPLRAGYRFDSGRDEHTVTAGIGYVDKHVGVDLSLRQDVQGNDETRLQFSLRYHVQ
jgi:hypothetical protein